MLSRIFFLGVHGGMGFRNGFVDTGEGAADSLNVPSLFTSMSINHCSLHAHQQFEGGGWSHAIPFISQAHAAEVHVSKIGHMSKIRKIL